MHELINESLAISMSYTLFFYSDYNNKFKEFKELKYNIGWFVVGSVLTMILWNAVIISRQSFMVLKAKLRSYQA